MSGVSVVEGNTGTRSAAFTVTLSAAATQTVTVSYATGGSSIPRAYTVNALISAFR